MSQYAIIKDGAVINVIEADADFAEQIGATLINAPIVTTTETPVTVNGVTTNEVTTTVTPPTVIVGIGWTTPDGVNWTPPTTAAPTPQQQAAAGIVTLAAEQPAIAAQLQADITSVSAGWDTLTSTERTAIMGRVLTGFDTVMTAVQTNAVATGVLRPGSP